VAPQWFVNGAMIRGQHNARWNPILGKLEEKKIPSHRSKNSINRILPKVRARLAKFVKNRPSRKSSRQHRPHVGDGRQGD
jgi:hypothetical protein